MTIHVVGPCQTIPLAACLAVMNPDVRVERLPGTADVSTIGPDDLVFRQRDRPNMTKSRPGSREIIYPGIWFNAFHPDVVFLIGPWGPVAPPLGADHSSLVLYGWHRGLTAAQTAKLFTEAVFEKLRFFDCWGDAKSALIEEGRDLGFAFDATFARIERFGCFMHSPIHPALSVMAELARELVRRAGLASVLDAPEPYLDDPLIRGAVWPVYPEIARRLGLPGAFAFKPAHVPGALPALLDLEEFIARSFDAYAVAPPQSLACKRLENDAYRDLESVAGGERKGSRNGTARHAPASAAASSPSPYADLPAVRFWRRAVERVNPSDVDPVGTPPFRVDREVRIATAGSCFAQSMSRVLTRAGYRHLVTEPDTQGLPAEQARAQGYGVFSTRSGNVYTARQLLQLFDRAYGTFAPDESAWQRPDGRYVDPFRPLIEPDGFASPDDVATSRQTHLAAVRSMFEQLDVLIFTLGLTEAWRSTTDGAVFPLAPGVSAGRMDAVRYEFVNFTAAQVRDDLDAFLARLRGVNADARVVLTVSPQPPIATYEPRHVLVSSVYTKAALRVAADEIERAHANVWYFPGYELVAGGFNRGAYFASDLRTVTPEGVDRVMRLFLAHCAVDSDLQASDGGALVANERLADMATVCDEELIAYGGSAPLRSGRYGPAPHSEYAAYEWSHDFSIDPAAAESPAEAAMEVLAAASMRAPVRALLPAGMHSRTVVTVPCTVRNDGDVALASGGKHAIFLCYRWFDAAGALTEIGRAIHTPLPAVLAPGAEVTVPMRIEAPQYAGRYQLRVALLQSEVAWFDDVAPSNGIEATVEVAAKGAAAV